MRKIGCPGGQVYITRNVFTTAIALALFQLANLALAETARSRPVPRELVEGRLQRYAGDDSRRETTVKQMFTEDWCADDRL